MGKRDNWTPERRAREREQNRLRMRAKYQAMTAEDRAARAAIQMEREKERAAVDPDFAKRRAERIRLASLRAAKRDRQDPAKRASRLAAVRKWQERKRIDREYDAYLALIEGQEP